jgi:hypothetical protein
MYHDHGAPCLHVVGLKIVSRKRSEILFCGVKTPALTKIAKIVVDLDCPVFDGTRMNHPQPSVHRAKSLDTQVEGGTHSQQARQPRQQ